LLLLRSQQQAGKIFALLLGDADLELSLTEIAERTRTIRGDLSDRVLDVLGTDLATRGQTLDFTGR
jgi:hypothetical protein